MSDPIDEAYEKYIAPHNEVEGKIICPRCESENVDRRSGYRGEYRCEDCGYFWQVGGWRAT